MFDSPQDLQTIDLEEFKYGGTNITAFRLVDPDSPIVQQTVSEWLQSELNSENKANKPVYQVTKN